VVDFLHVPDYLRRRIVPIPLLATLGILGGSAVAGALSNTKGARTSTSSSTNTITPTFAPEFKTLSDMLRFRAEDRLRNSVDMGGYQASGVANINDAFAGIQQASDNNLTSRGLATSPVAGAVGANLQTARGGSIAEFLNTIPLLQRQLQDQDTASALNVLNIGRGTTSTGTGTGVAPGSAAGGAFGSAAEMLAFLAGQGLLGGGGGKT
jgi:hypothetical protein